MTIVSCKIPQVWTLHGSKRRPGWDQNSCWLQRQQVTEVSMLPDQTHFLEQSGLPCAAALTAFSSLKNHWLWLFSPRWACTLLNYLWSGWAPTSSLACFLHIDPQTHSPRTTASQSCFSVLSTLVPAVSRCLRSWRSAFPNARTLMPCIYFILLT